MRKIKINWISGLCLSLACLCCMSFTFSGKGKTITNGNELIKEMYNRWEKKWYPNFAFEQRAIFYEEDKVTKEEIWQEIYSQPGNLHIRFNGFESGNGVVFKSDSLYTFKNNQLQAKTFQIHPLVLLAFDVYFLKPEDSVNKLEKIGFDLTKMTEAEWQGRDAYVIGTTDANDDKTPQFWVDKERLYVVRVLTNVKGSTRDVEMNNYQLVEKNWVAMEIIFKTNGKLTLREEYFNLSFPKKKNDTWYNPEQFKTAKW
ncbi:outer membrane lipoprotein-sorting protein [Pontibacter locisalis]|uniref:Outer membrane lipoprotein-sorting protein n=1 Tax=Pontibacter locisalis TaxID=1719035 RepID=A0ABW5IFK0_9BACT